LNRLEYDSAVAGTDDQWKAYIRRVRRLAERCGYKLRRQRPHNGPQDLPGFQLVPLKDLPHATKAPRIVNGIGIYDSIEQLETFLLSEARDQAVVVPPRGK
jgi:hypothetical protein